jgi:hypothetical protein
MSCKVVRKTEGGGARRIKESSGTLEPVGELRRWAGLRFQRGLMGLNRIDVFVRGTANGLWHKNGGTGRVGTAPSRSVAGGARGPDVASSSVGQLNMFALYCSANRGYLYQQVIAPHR